MFNGNIYNINLGTSFVDALAERFLQNYSGSKDELSRVLFLLPTRRACQNLTEAFLRQMGLEPTILPQILPIMDTDEDAIFLTGDTNILQNLKPMINDTECVLTLTRLIMQKPQLGLSEISLAQAYSLAKNLKILMDTVQNRELDFSSLKDLVSQEYASHWQQTLDLLQIITKFWPQILQEQNKMDSSAYRKKLLEEQIKLWQKNTPKQKIVVAGTTAAYPILKKVVETVYNLPGGEIYLYGLDRHLDEDSWQQIGFDENHPQYEIKELLDYLKISRDDVEDIITNPNIYREKLVSEIMRPAKTSAKWRELMEDGIAVTALDGIHLLNCADLRQEAKAIAMIIRHTLDQPEKTAALVTMDRNLSRRVVSELQKWGINADDSAGKPLHLTAIGIYLRLIWETIEKNTQAAQIGLMKHPFTAMRMSHHDFNLMRNHLELVWRNKEDYSDSLQAFNDEFNEIIRPLKEQYNQPRVNIKDLLTTHIKVAEALADTAEKSGEKIIWKHEDGQMAAEVISDFLSHCDILETINTNDYGAFFTQLLSQQSVRLKYGMHPRVKILGPIESRLSSYDVTIIGEVNEGSWPKLPEADMWMSRPMKKEFGLPLPERSIGVMAADFAHLLNSPQVYLTRAERLDDTPTNKSRWWLRLETVLNANFAADKKRYDFIYDKKYSLWAQELERQGTYQPIEAPNPRPPLNMRPRKLSATNIEVLLRDPYTIFAKYILSLYPLDELDQDIKPYDFGNIVHAVLQKFNNQYNQNFPPDAFDELLRLGEQEFAEAGVPAEQKAFWYPRFANAMQWIVNKENEYRLEISRVNNEITGSINFESIGGDFTVTAKADRIDITKDGHLNIIDYKTGHARSVKEMLDSKAPQLPIEGLIAQSGGFADIPSYKVASLKYWDFKKEISTDLEQSDKAIKNISTALQDLINAFDDEHRPYLAKPVQTKQQIYSDYDHLSRLLEWSVKDNTENKEVDDE